MSLSLIGPHLGPNEPIFTMATALMAKTKSKIKFKSTQLPYVKT